MDRSECVLSKPGSEGNWSFWGINEWKIQIFPTVREIFMPLNIVSIKKMYSTYWLLLFGKPLLNGI